MTSPGKNSFKIGLLSLLLLLVASTTIYLMTRPAPQLKVAIQFTGYTNSTTTYTTREGTFLVTIVAFRIVNLGSRSLFQWDVSSYDTKYKSGEWGIDYGGPEFQGVLAPGQSKTVSVVAPWAVHGPWRAGFRFSRVDWRYRVANWPPWVQTLLRTIISERRLMMHYEAQAFSDWVDIPRVAATPANQTPFPNPECLAPATKISPFLPSTRLDLAPAHPPSSEHEGP